MKRLMMYLKDYKKESILAPLFKLLEAFFELLVPLVMANIIDYGISNRNMGYIGKMGLLLLLLGVVGLASSITAQFFAAKAAVGFSTQLRQALFDHIEDLSFTDIDKAGTSTMITRMTSDVNQVQSGINMTLRLFLRSPIIVFGAMIMAFTIDVKCALIFVVAIPLLSVVVFGIILSTIPMYKKVQSKLDQVLGITRENLTGVRVIRAFHQEAKEADRFRENNEALSAMQIFVGKISACMNPVTYIIVNGAIIALIYTGAVQVNIGNLSQGEVVAIINYMNQILVELVKLANLIVTMTKALACAERVASVFDIGADAAYVGAQDQKLADKVDKSAPFLDFKHVSLTYQGAGAPTLQDMNFTVNRGDTVGIIGGTGSGKTSLVNLIPGFYPATEGEILLEGRDIRTMSDEELRGRIGVVPQKAVLFKGTIRSNLQWGKPDATEEEMWKALELAQASEVVDGKPGKLDATVAQNGKNFSGGQRQRLTIARALVRNPEILILDDSASALDYATDAKLRAAIRTLEDKTTTFIVSQRASTIRHADKIIVLDDGEIAGMGTHDELLKDCTVYQEIYYSQYPEQRGGVR
ncbi:MAG: ABC transporter ATP-binding protein [Lachnospiraceae bacterium]|jgi:ABC-type multidrug transport system fused ATPase/permease subunit|nr:ABC transporter ATP-binding protein/permease [Lachnospiraceae bacterium]MDY3658440.1 ABC transporter ATP-binding protein [Lachnospiraceae bacterium]RHQ75494.1 ABC transporter ATP-binding protein [Firmicutes bacterium AF22-6AC]